MITVAPPTVGPEEAVNEVMVGGGAGGVTSVPTTSIASTVRNLPAALEPLRTIRTTCSVSARSPEVHTFCW